MTAGKYTTRGITTASGITTGIKPMHLINSRHSMAGALDSLPKSFSNGMGIVFCWG